MNYANMIEEKSLKKGFIIATLISTVVGTFSTSLSLHDKIQERRQQRKQKQLDDKQSGQIRELESQVKRLRQGGARDPQDSDGSRSSSRDRRYRKRRDSSDSDNEFASSNERSKALIRDRYEDYESRIGSRYAQGDLITQTKLQAQIIALQETVIAVLTDALTNDRPLTKADINRLVYAQQTAQTGTLEALQDQYERMRNHSVHGDSRGNSRLLMDSDEVFGPVQRQRTLPIEDGRTKSVAPMRSLQSTSDQQQRLFCAYSEELQFDSKRSLVSAFDGSGDRRCPECGLRLQVDMTSGWVFEIPGQGEYSLDARFVVKCHTINGDFACAICHYTRDVDCFCGNVEALVKHLGRDHRIEDFEGEVDFERRT